MNKHLLLLMLLSCLSAQAAIGSGEGNRSAGGYELREPLNDITTAIVSEDVGRHFCQSFPAQSSSDRRRSGGFFVTAGGNDADEGNAVQQTADGEYIVAGWTDSYGVGQR